jgi:hypothetical protein
MILKKPFAFQQRQYFNILNLNICGRTQLSKNKFQNNKTLNFSFILIVMGIKFCLEASKIISDGKLIKMTKKSVKKKKSVRGFEPKLFLV